MVATQAQRPREDHDAIEIEEAETNNSAPGSGGKIPGNQVSETLQIPVQHQLNSENQHTDEYDEVSQNILII